MMVKYGTDKMLEQTEYLSKKFRNAIERAQREGMFLNNEYMETFPVGCCGNVSYLLAEYLLSYDIHTLWYSSCRDDDSHAWLIIKDKSVMPPICTCTTLPDDIVDIMSGYAGRKLDNVLKNERYEEECFGNCTIVDITGDQFTDYDKPVYVGPFDTFHRSFEFREAVDFLGLTSLEEMPQKQLVELFDMIIRYI